MHIDYERARHLFVLAMSTALGFLTYAVASAPTRVASRLGMRGLKRRRAIEAGGLFAQAEPLVRWMGVRVSGILSDEQRAALDKQITLAGDYLGLTPEEYVGMSILTGLCGAGFGVVAGLAAKTAMGAFVIVFTILGAAIPYIQISEIAEERLKIINRRLPVAIDLMALSMSAGLDFPGAVRQVVEKSSNPEDPLVEEMTRIMQELSLGKTRRHVLQEFADRAPVASVSEFVAALQQAEERGNPVADVLQIQAQISRQRRTVNAEEAAAKAGVKLLGPLVLIFGCIILLIFGPMVLTFRGKNVFD